METENWKSWRLPHKQMCQAISGIVSLLSQKRDTQEFLEKNGCYPEARLLDGFTLFTLLRSRSIYQLNYLFMYDSMPDF